VVEASVASRTTRDDDTAFCALEPVVSGYSSRLGHDWPIWKRIAPESFVVNLDLGEIHFSRDTINGDRGAYGEIFVGGSTGQTTPVRK
jgi:hypothetical protein